MPPKTVEQPKPEPNPNKDSAGNPKHDMTPKSPPFKGGGAKVVKARNTERCPKRHFYDKERNPDGCPYCKDEAEAEKRAIQQAIEDKEKAAAEEDEAKKAATKKPKMRGGRPRRKLAISGNVDVTGLILRVFFKLMLEMATLMVCLNNQDNQGRLFMVLIAV